MPTFRFQAIDGRGGPTSGTLQADDRGGAVKALDQRGLMAVSLEVDASAEPGAVASRRTRLLQRRPTIIRPVNSSTITTSSLRTI